MCRSALTRTARACVLLSELPRSLHTRQVRWPVPLVAGAAGWRVEPALLGLGLVPELATEDLVLMQHEQRMLAFACESTSLSTSRADIHMA